MQKLSVNTEKYSSLTNTGEDFGTSTENIAKGFCSTFLVHKCPAPQDCLCDATPGVLSVGADIGPRSADRK